MRNDLLRAAPGAAQLWIEEHKNFDDDECLIWPFARTSFGYASWRHGGKTRRVSRIMCEHRHGPPPTPKHQSAHSCGKGHLACVNPEHLDWRTPKENHADLLIHGTLPRGKRNGQTKLSEADVLAIRATFGISHANLAEHYGVSRSQIGYVIGRRSWAWL